MSNNPYKKYIKVTLGRVSCKILDPISGEQVEVILEGDPKLKPDTCILEIWTQVEDTYFQRANKSILNEGLVISYESEAITVEFPNSVSDEDMTEALAGKFMQVKNLLDKFTSTVPAERMLNLAEDMNRPVKTIDAIKARLSELQKLEYEKKK